MREGMRLIAAATLMLTACSPSPGGSAATTEPSLPPTTLSPTTTSPLVVGCPDEGEFFEGGVVGEVDHPGSDSTTVGLISWDGDDTCETFSFTFTTSEGAPPTTPPSVRAIYVDDLPVIRLFVDTDHTVITDQLVETALVDRLYVVRALSGGMFIDLHLAGPAQARLKTSSSPAGMTLDLQPGIVEYPKSPFFSNTFVINSPTHGSTVDSPVEVSGYSRSFESNVVVIATEADQVIAEELTTAADSVETWGEFTVNIDLPAGERSLFIGDEEAEDGGLEGWTLNLTVR